MKPSLVFMMRLSGSVKFFCAFASGSSEGGAAGLPGFLRPSASRFWSASARACRSASAAAFASPSSSALAARIFSARRFLSPTQDGISSPLLSRPKAASSLASAFAAASNPPRDLGLQFRRPLAHPLVAHGFVLGGVGLDLRPVKRDMAELDQPGPLAKAQHLAEKPRQ